MGEIADMILDGILDEWTGEFIGEAVGYPRSLDPDHPSNYRKGEAFYTPDQQLYGIRKYLRKTHNLKRKGFEGTDYYIKKYCVEILEMGKHEGMYNYAYMLSNNFGDFRNWISKQLNPRT